MKKESQKECQDECPKCGASWAHISWSNIEPPQDQLGLMCQLGSCSECHQIFYEYFRYAHTRWQEDK